jgi:hypothetical protein
MVHFYHAVSDRELFAIAAQHAGDLESLLASLLDWIAEHADTSEGEPTDQGGNGG